MTHDAARRAVVDALIATHATEPERDAILRAAREAEDAAAADTRAALERLAERCANLLTATQESTRDGTWYTTREALTAARAVLGGIAGARRTCAHGSPLDTGCDACEVALRQVAQRARLSVPAGCSHGCGRDARVCTPCHLGAIAARSQPLRAALRALLARYRADAGDPESPEAIAAVTAARSWSEDCAVCGEDHPDEPRPSRDGRRVYCSPVCARSDGCGPCLGEGREHDGAPCRVCRPDDYAEHETEKDDRLHSAAEEAKVDNCNRRHT